MSSRFSNANRISCLYHFVAVYIRYSCRLRVHLARIDNFLLLAGICSLHKWTSKPKRSHETTRRSHQRFSKVWPGAVRGVSSSTDIPFDRGIVTCVHSHSAHICGGCRNAKDAARFCRYEFRQRYRQLESLWCGALGSTAPIVRVVWSVGCHRPLRGARLSCATASTGSLWRRRWVRHRSQRQSYRWGNGYANERRDRRDE